MIMLFTTLFNALFVHVGQTVLFTLPRHWLWIGGDVTLEAAVFGATSGLRFLTLFALFNVFNRNAPIAQLIRLMPRALRDLGVVVLIAVTYVPQTVRQWQRIREAQAIRGHQLRGWRDWQPLLIPLLVSSLEQAMSLAEAMVARGYGATADARQPIAVQISLLLGLLLSLLGWGITFWLGWPGWLVMGVGLAILLLLLWRIGRATTYTRYQPEQWTGRETVLVVLVLLPLVVMMLWGETAVYTPYPALTFPAFNPLLGITLLAFLAPLFGQNERSDRQKTMPGSLVLPERPEGFQVADMPGTGEQNPSGLYHS
jgi:energy-coupling factor transport system permease protein